MKRRDPRITAHRGWRRSHEENTIEALRAAVAEGCGAVEFDTRRTADGRWVVYHDKSLRRLHGSLLRIAAATYREICTVAPLPLLETALDLFDRNCTPLIEVKEPETAGVEDLIAIIETVVRRAPAVVIARGREMPRLLTERLPGTPILLYDRHWRAALARIDEPIAGFDLPYDEIAPGEEAERIRGLHARDRKLAVFTVNEPDACARWLAAGADWVITDVPWELEGPPFEVETAS